MHFINCTVKILGLLFDIMEQIEKAEILSIFVLVCFSETLHINLERKQL